MGIKTRRKRVTVTCPKPKCRWPGYTSSDPHEAAEAKARHVRECHGERYHDS